MANWDVIVVGGGLMGCATAYQLARRGCRVLLLEQFAIGHAHGSSHGHSRIIRYSYETPGYVQLMVAAYRAWAELEQDAATPLLHTTGGLDLGLPGTPGLQACYASLRAVGIDCEWLDHAELRQRFPQFQLPEAALGLYQAAAGILPASRCVATLATQARRYGATIEEGATVQRLAPDGAGALVQTATASYRAERVVISAGSWAGQLLHTLNLDLPLTVTREQVVFFAPRQPELFEPGRFPIFIDYGIGAPDGASLDCYGFPLFDIAAVKVARHRKGPIINPADPATAPDPRESERVRGYVAQLLPAAAGDIVLAETCRYTTTPDTDFILDHHPTLPQFIVGSPCSGHGFKFGPLMGTILADLAQQGSTSHDIAPFTLRRFGV